MTTIHFHYTDSYNNPSRGSLAFMPHRRHAANETEVLPKPFTIPLLNGEVTVNLQPNSSSWVWIVTEYFEGISTSFYTSIPDRDGVLEHTELVHINPSSLPAPYDAVEPVWWAEMRQYKTTVSDTLLQSGEALAEAQAAIEAGKASVESTQQNASLAKAYAEQSREDSYASREYRDEAEQWRDEAKEQADRAASGPESAAQRAENAAESAQSNEVATRGYRDEARNSAAEARSSETAANGAASTATERASDARNEANRAESEANRAQGYADELMAGPRDYVEQAETARDLAEAARDLSQSYRDEALGHVGTASNHATQSHEHAIESQGYADLAESAATAAQDHAETAHRAMANGPWHDMEFLGTWEPLSGGELQVRLTASGMQFKGVARNGGGSDIATFPQSFIDEVDARAGWSIRGTFGVGAINSNTGGEPPVVQISGGTTLKLARPTTGFNGLYLYFTGVIIPLD